jgi:hypothetical protein
MMKSLCFFFLILFMGLDLKAQTISYTFRDPCTGVYNSVTVPTSSGSVLVSYYGMSRVFNQIDFANGSFDSWLNETFQSSNSPCAGSVGLGNVLSQTQSTIITSMNILNSISAAIGSSTTPKVNSSNVAGGGNNNSGGSGGSTGSTESESSGGETQTGSDEGSTDVGSGSLNVTSGVSTATNSSSDGGDGSYNPPVIVASGDIVGFKSVDGGYDYKINSSYTSVRWDGMRSSGGLLDYTSSIMGPNITLFTAFIAPKQVTLISNTITIGFEGKNSFYNTISVGQIRSFKKFQLKVVYLGAFSYGRMYQETLVGTALMAGGMWDKKINKRFDLKLSNIFVYAPFVRYYDDLVLSSPYVMLPTVGLNIGLSSKFKLNLNVGGSYAITEKIMNYTIQTGTRIIL